MSIHRGNSLGTHLIAEGLCPKNALNVELHIPASGVITLRFDVYLHSDDIPKIQRALAALAAESEPVKTP